MIRSHCGGCHRPGGIAPFSLMEVDDARLHLPEMRAAVDTGLMPPFDAVADPDCAPTRPWRDDPRLAPAEVALLHAWLGAAGEPTALPEPAPTDLVAPTLTLAPTSPFLSSGDHDQFVCFLYDPRFTRTEYITSLQVRPTIPGLVHHADISVVPPDQAIDVLRQLGALAFPRPCQTLPGVPLHDWAPGNQPLELPAGVAIPIAPGALIAYQLHYHPNGGGGADGTQLDLMLTETPPAWSYRLLPLGNEPAAPQLQPGEDDPSTGPAFLIPANRRDHVEWMRLPLDATLVPDGARLVAVTPHTHLTATHVRATIDRANGERECLANGPWRFDWQRTYGYAGELDALPRIAPGDAIDVTCHWDNTIENPYVQRLLHDLGLVAPIDLHLGVATTDEMCAANFGMATPTVADSLP